jgi:hypothetical protein
MSRGYLVVREVFQCSHKRRGRAREARASGQDSIFAPLLPNSPDASQAP